MPTGYTAKLCNEEVPFNDFVMTCARAMGACVMMRDDPFDAPIPERWEPSDYHSKKLDELRTEIAATSAMSDDQCADFAQAEYKKQFQYHREEIAKDAVRGSRLRKMREQVISWTSPSPDHAGLKTFMLEQLDLTLRYDGDDSYHRSALSELKPESGAEWKAAKLAKIQHDIEYHTKEHAEEVRRTEGRNTWIKQLRESLAP